MLPPPPEDESKEAGSIPSPDVPNYMPEAEEQQQQDGVGSISPDELFDPPKSGESLREAVTKELPSDAREEVILVARNLNVPDNDPLWAILLALQKYNRQLIEVGTATEAAKTVIVSTVNDAPEKLNSAVADIMRVTQINREEAIVNKENSESGKTLIKWGTGIAAGGLLAAVASLALISSIAHSASQLHEQKNELVERVEFSQRLQSLAGRRLQLEAEKREFKGYWKELQENWRAEGETEENLANKARLEELHRALEQKEIKIYEEEDNAFQRLKN